MKIKDSLYESIQRFQDHNKVEKPEGNERKGIDKPGSDKDQVSLSSEARELARAVKVASDSDDVRTARVAELKEKVESGQYQTDSESTARKLLQDDLDIWL